MKPWEREEGQPSPEPTSETWPSASSQAEADVATANTVEPMAGPMPRGGPREARAGARQPHHNRPNAQRDATQADGASSAGPAKDGAGRWVASPRPALARLPDEPLAAVGLREGVLINGGYRVERALGVGGMGVVALAVDEGLERKVAIKFIRPELFAFPEMRTFFHNEARSMARVAHRNVLSVFAFGEHRGTPYFVMEYVDGKTADQWLRQRQPGTLPDLDEAMSIFDQACLGVSAIHDTCTVHRDLKPSNLLIDWSKGPRSHPSSHGPPSFALGRGPVSERAPDRGFRVAVGDLGVARVIDSATGGNFIVGSAAWMAPEAALGEDEAPELAHLRDVYALGCIAYELLTGRPPFTGPTDMNILSQHVLEEPTRPSRLRPDLPPSYDAIILKALAKDPKKRWGSAEAFRRALLAEHTGTREPERILIVDDDPDWRTIIGTSLSTRFPDAVIDQVGDGQAALVAFAKEPYSVVLVDLQMPGLDGAGLTIRLRSRQGAERTPIIVLTAAGGPREWQRLLEIGADAFLVKPVNADDVELVIRRTLRSRCAPPPPSTPALTLPQTT